MLTRRTHAWTWACGLCLLILVSAAKVLLLAADGILDPTFGEGGKVKTNFLNGPSSEDIQDIVIQPDGKIVAVGSVTGAKKVPAVAVARYNADGSLDATFGRGGRVFTQVVETGSRATGVALQADGKIVVIGNASGPLTLQDFVVLRYNVDGSLDPTFGKSGVVTTDFGQGIDNARDLVIDDFGRIIVVGGSFPRVRNIEVARYNSDGSLDKTFAAGGLLMSGAGLDARAVALQADGRILIAGSRAGIAAADTNFVIVRLADDGSFDTSFGEAGVVVTDFRQGADAVNTLLVQPDGMIVAGGTITEKGNTEQQFGLARYFPDGSRDPTFGDAGLVITDLGSDSEFGADGCLESDGRIVFAGTSRDEFAIVRYNIDGTLDQTFGTNGVVRADFSTPTQPETEDHAFAVAVQPDGKIVVGGTSIETQTFTSDAALLRLGSPE